MKKLKVHNFKQDTDYTCGPTSAQMLFSYFGLRVSEGHLAHQMHTTKKYGTRHNEMIRTARNNGFYVYVNNNASLLEIEYFLNMKLPVIVHYIEHTIGEGHYGVITKVDAERVYFTDPWFGSKLSYDREAFLKRWKSEDGKHPKWLMVINKTSIPLGKEYLPRQSSSKVGKLKKNKA